MDFDSLMEEQLEKARQCKTPEELLALVKEQGIELTDEEISMVTGGSLLIDGREGYEYRSWS